MLYKFLCGSLLAITLLVTLDSCRASGPDGRDSEASPSMEATYERGNLLILMTDGRQNPQLLVKEFEQYQLKNEGLASRSQPKYSFSFNIAKIGAEEIIQLLNAHATVREATYVVPGN